MNIEINLNKQIHLKHKSFILTGNTYNIRMDSASTAITKKVSSEKAL